MLPTVPTPITNLLLNALPSKDQRHILAACEPANLKHAEILSEPGSRIIAVYFPTGSVVSLASTTNGHAHLSLGLVGHEGMLGLPLLLGIAVSQYHALVQNSGPALRMERKYFSQLLAVTPSLQRNLKRYLFVSMGQQAQAAACGRFHLLVARLARWLLMTQDKTQSDQFHITHEFLAEMLGVRRAGVTRAASSLQARQLIHYSRGDITVLDRPGLELAACACYEADDGAGARKGA